MEIASCFAASMTSCKCFLSLAESPRYQSSSRRTRRFPASTLRRKEVASAAETESVVVEAEIGICFNLGPMQLFNCKLRVLQSEAEVEQKLER